jgi:hypothetical protein
MRLEISITEVKEVIQNYYHLHVGIKNVGEDKIKLSYYGSIILSLKEIKEEEVVFSYEVNGFVALMAKGVHYFLKEKVEFDALEWNTVAREVTFNLKKVKELREVINFLYISEIHFADEIILLELSVKTKEQKKLNE